MLAMPRGALDKSISHILGGVLFSCLGLWHLFNHITLFVSLDLTSPSSSSYVAPAWFPAPRIRHMELIVMLAGGLYGFLTQMLAYSPLPFLADGSIPPKRLPNHEHAIMYAALLVYASAAIYLDRRHRHGRSHTTVCMLLQAAVFAQELFVFHVHSTDHAGVEGRHHWFLQAAAATCLATALLGAGAGGFPAEVQFAASLVRSAALAFQGLWGVVIGVAWVPGMAPMGCYLEEEDDGHGGVGLRCHGGEDGLRRAVAVVNLQFGWSFVLVTVLVVGVYVYVCRKFQADGAGGEVYGRLPEVEAAEEEEEDKLHSMKKCNCKEVVHDLQGFTSMEIVTRN